MTTNILSDNFSEPLNEVKSAKIDIHVGDGSLTIDSLSKGERLTGGETLLAAGEQVLASGSLQYFESQGAPDRSLVSGDGQATFTLKGTPAPRPRFRLPWSACNGASKWHIHLNPTVASDITAHSNGGNLELDLAGMSVTRLSADTGGGNIHSILPDNAADLSVSARTGGGNVTIEIGGGTTGSNLVDAHSGAGEVVIHLPDGLAARIHATTGLGKAIVDPRFIKTGKDSYQSDGFESAADRIEISAKSGAGNVVIKTR